MKRNLLLNTGIFGQLCRTLVYLILLLNLLSCNKKLSPGLDSKVPFNRELDLKEAKYIDWNITFIRGATDEEKSYVLQAIQNYVQQYVMIKNVGNPDPLKYAELIRSCPCDSSLWNYNAIPLFGTGQSAVPPPPPGKGVGGKGDLIEYILNNKVFESSDTLQMPPVTYKTVDLVQSTIDPSKILAVMDSGLDPDLFTDHFKGLLWQDVNASYTLRNFQFLNNYLPLDYSYDDEPHKHGTAVTTIALKALESTNAQVKPKVMVLKVLDNKKMGSTFTVSCALSYTIKNHATLVNASLGYPSSSEVDSILWKYVNLCNLTTPHAIPIVSAAGNLPGIHVFSNLCKNPNPANFAISNLTNKNLFFPASFCISPQISNVISVTGLRDTLTACFYQNFSGQYVSVGVVINVPNPTTCCSIPTTFMKSGYEGSSFSTPVVSGLMMSKLMENPNMLPHDCLNSISTIPGPNNLTIDGRHIVYSPAPIP